MDLTRGERSSIFFLISRRRDMNQILNNTWDLLSHIISKTSSYMHSGLPYLQQLLPHHPQASRFKLSPVPLFSFLSQLLSSLKSYAQSDFLGSWGDYLSKSKKGASLQNFIQSWLLHCHNSLECQLLGALSTCSDRKKLHLYLRLRKYIVQLTSGEHLDEVALKHEDTLTIIHRMFPSILRKEIARGVKQLYSGFRVAEAKIYACVFMQFILSIYESTGSEEQSLMAGDTKITSNINISNFSSIGNFSSNLHKQNGLYKPAYPPEINNYQIIEAKFLPHELERRQTHLAGQEHQSYYYSNSLNFSQTDQLSKHEPKPLPTLPPAQKENCGVNCKQQLNSSGIKREILIEEESGELKRSGGRFIEQLRELARRNGQFKSRMLLSGSQSVVLSEGQEESIRQAINVIHSSVVRNHKSRLY